jgi:hypothetical protein
LQQYQRACLLQTLGMKEVPEMKAIRAAKLGITQPSPEQH